MNSSDVCIKELEKKYPELSIEDIVFRLAYYYGYGITVDNKSMVKRTLIFRRVVVNHVRKRIELKTALYGNDYVDYDIRHLGRCDKSYDIDYIINEPFNIVIEDLPYKKSKFGEWMALFGGLMVILLFLSAFIYGLFFVRTGISITLSLLGLFGFITIIYDVFFDDDDNSGTTIHLLTGYEISKLMHGDKVLKQAKSNLMDEVYDEYGLKHNMLPEDARNTIDVSDRSIPELLTYIQELKH